MVPQDLVYQVLHFVLLRIPVQVVGLLELLLLMRVLPIMWISLREVQVYLIIIILIGMVLVQVNPFTMRASGDTLSKTFISYKKKVINGSETSDTYDVGVSLSGTPSWSSVTVSGKTVSSKASENIEESSRSATVTVTQSESGKKLTLDITQNAATIIYEYVFNLE